VILPINTSLSFPPRSTVPPMTRDKEKRLSIDIETTHRLRRGRGPELSWECRTREPHCDSPERRCRRTRCGGREQGCAACWLGGCGGRMCWGRTVSVGEDGSPPAI
jgi:hypothetical protein